MSGLVNQKYKTLFKLSTASASLACVALIFKILSYTDRSNWVIFGLCSIFTIDVQPIHPAWFVIFWIGNLAALGATVCAIIGCIRSERKMLVVSSILYIIGGVLLILEFVVLEWFFISFIVGSNTSEPWSEIPIMMVPTVWFGGKLAVFIIAALANKKVLSQQQNVGEKDALLRA